MLRVNCFIRRFCHATEKLMKVLNVAEKNDAAKSISEVLTRGHYSKVIPVYQDQDEFTPRAIEMNASETSPPPLLSEADLIAVMDKHGIGTDATPADHIETIKSRMYVGVRPDGKIIPGQLGMGLVEGYDAMGYEMSKPHLRAELEADLKRICEGKIDRQVVLDRQVKKYKEVFIEACRQAQKIVEALAKYLGEEAQAIPEGESTAEMLSRTVPVMKCPHCGQDMQLKTRKENKGYYIGCVAFPGCRCAIWLPQSLEHVSVVEDSTCSDCGPPVHKVKFKFKPGSVPPILPEEYIGCVGGCETDVMTMIGIQLPKPPSSATTQGSSQSVSRNTSQSKKPTVTNSSSRNYSTATKSGSNLTPTGTMRSPPTTRPAQHQRTQNNGQIRSTVNSQQNGYQGGDNSRLPLAIVTGNVQHHGEHADRGNEIVCNCGIAALLLTVRKEGPNTGRQFYKCSTSSCIFFLWAEEANADPGNGNSRPDPFTSNQSNQNRGYTNGGSNQSTKQMSAGGGGGGVAVNCKCGQQAKSLTVQKEGPNKGRPFYSCPAPRGEGCNFFLWAEEANADPGNGNSRPDPFTSNQSNQNRGYTNGGSNQSTNQMSAGGGGGGVAVNCKCGQQAKSHGGNGNKRSVSLSNTSSEGPTQKRARKCGLCGVEGHTRKTCPHK